MKLAPQMRTFAEHLIALEIRGNKFLRTKLPDAFLVCERLRPSLASLLGNTGFRALLGRALACAAAEVPSLNAVELSADGSLVPVDKPALPADPDELARGNVVLVAHLLSLLVAFIGEKLTLQLVREVWPQLSLNNLELHKGDEK